MNKLILSILALTIMSLLAFAEEMDQKRLKAFFVYPATNAPSLEISWIDIVACVKPDGNCTQLVDRVKLRDVKVNGKLKSIVQNKNTHNLVFTDTQDKNPRVLARQDFQNHWYPRVELCHSTGVAQCEYVLERDKTTKSISLNILASQ